MAPWIMVDYDATTDPLFVPLRSKRYQFSKRPTTIPHLPPDRIAFVSSRVPHAQEVPENGVTLSSLRVRYAPFGESPRVLPRSGSSLAKL